MAAEIPVRAIRRDLRFEASMRPRLNGRGNSEHGVPNLGVLLSFNEAAAQWPRKSHRCARGGGAGMSFNEAAAQWPRKWWRPGPMRYTSACFNEAAAQWPRKLALALAPIAVHFQASMRPRLNGRGNPDALDAQKIGATGFNEAAAQWPRKLLAR